MSADASLYPVRLRWAGHEYLLLWVTGIEGASGLDAIDHLVCDGHRRISIFDSTTLARDAMANRVAWSEEHRVDLDDVDGRLNGLSGRDVLRQDCTAFLRAWNMLDDIAATVRGPALDTSKAMKCDAVLWDVYDMIFQASLGTGKDDPDIVSPDLFWSHDDAVALAHGLRGLIDAGMGALRGPTGVH